MKKLLTLVILLSFALAVNAQGLFSPVAPFPVTQKENLAKGLNLKNFKWQMRFDATIQLNENLYNKELKQLESKMAAGIGIAIGFQHYVPKSDVDPTPVNNYGVSIGLLNQEQLKIIAQVNIWQYIKFGPTFTPNMPEPYGKVGFFIGTGITF